MPVHAMTRPSYARIALRTGAVSPAALRRATAERRARGGSLEQILVRSGALLPELADFVRAALERAQGTCDRCGGWTDPRARARGEALCACATARVA